MQICDPPQKKQTQKALKNLIRGRLGLHLGGFGGSFGKGLEALGAFWVVLEAPFSCLYLQWSSEMLLEPSGLDFGSILMDLGRILGGFWKDFGKVWEECASILGDSGPLWTILGCWGVLGRSSQDFGWCSLLQWNSF